MKVGKLLENVMKGKLEIDTKIKINNTKIQKKLYINMMIYYKNIISKMNLENK